MIYQAHPPIFLCLQPYYKKKKTIKFKLHFTKKYINIIHKYYQINVQFIYFKLNIKVTVYIFPYPLKKFFVFMSCHAHECVLL